MKKSRLDLVEEIFSSITHGVGWVLFIIGITVFFVTTSFLSPKEIIGASIFALALFLLYCFSTLYHALSYTKAKRVFTILDKSAIYSLIAGTYTPFILSLSGGEKWVILSGIWIIAISGIVLTALPKYTFSHVSVLVYLCMGWMVLFFIKPLSSVIHVQTALLLLSGGVLYISGIMFYALRKIPFHHTIWHLFVLAGSIFHFLAVTEFLRT